MPTQSVMLPTAGLYLPETLHRRDDSTPTHTEAEGTRLKYFQRKNGRLKQEPRKADDRGSIIGGTSEDSTSVFASLTTAFTYADFASSSNKASSETVSFANLIMKVRTDITEASRLYLSPAVSNFLDAWPDKRTWVENTLLEVRRALSAIGMDMDAAPANGDDDETTLRRKFEWSLSHQKRLLKKEQQLEICHHNLAGAIHVMQTFELCGLPGQDPIFEAPVRPWVPIDERNALRGPYSRQKYRMSQTNSSVSSVNLSEVEQDNIGCSSVSSLPVELPGSTPDDLAHSNNLSSHASRNIRTSCDVNFGGQTTLRRSRARQDQSRSFARLDTKSRASIDVTRPLPTLTEKTIERNDSTTSTTTTVTVPLIAKRYRAHAVNVHRHPRHKSLPTELPYLATQSSLIDDLVDWVLPSATSERLPSNEWNSSPVVSSPTTSIASSSAVPQMPARDLHTTSGSALTITVTQPTPQPSPEPDNIEILPLSKSSSYDNSAPLQEHRVRNDASQTRNEEETAKKRINRSPPERATSLQLSHSFVTRQPLPRSYSFDMSMNTSTEAARPNAIPSHIFALGSGNEELSTHSSDKSSLVSSNKSFISPPSSSAAANTDSQGTTSSTSSHTTQKINDNAELSLLQERMPCQAYVKESEMPASLPLSLGKPTSPMSQRSLLGASENDLLGKEVVVPVSPSTVGSEVALKPMSAQAKRQAAHRRRMQKAFGEA